MSKPRFKAVVGFDTLAHANTVKTSVATQLVGKDIFEEHRFSTFVDSDDGPTLLGEWRFNNEVDRDSLKDWILNQIQNHPVVKSWIETARVSWHSCTHNDPVIRDCRTSSYSEWIRV